ncbi:MAG: SDR family NAD(P)-dependent oxidoreductase, partial [Betaproteobacteria bacterium]|nr:SDR family NAD(P)-dependent oxidoreductase [Betaproteobacteria bacterium]
MRACDSTWRGGHHSGWTVCSVHGSSQDLRDRRCTHPGRVWAHCEGGGSHGRHAPGHRCLRQPKASLPDTTAKPDPSVRRGSRNPSPSQRLTRQITGYVDMTDQSSLNRFSLAGRVALVTGSAQGIGRAIAIALAGAGARVACADMKADACAATAASICAKGGDAIAVTTDVSKEADTAAAVAAVKARWGALHVLVHGAAAADPSGTVVEYSLT